MTLSADKLKRAKVVRIQSVNLIELDVDLGFGVSVTRVFTLDGIRVSDVPRDKRREAVHCLVVLLGGKSVFVQPENTLPTARFARVYLDERIHGSPVGLVQHAPGFDGPILDVSVFFEWLAGCDFSVREVKAILNGTPAKSGKA